MGRSHSRFVKPYNHGRIAGPTSRNHIETMKAPFLLRPFAAALSSLAAVSASPRYARWRIPMFVVLVQIVGQSHALAAFDSTELSEGISKSLGVLMLFGFVLGIAAVIAGGFAIRRGEVDQGKMSIIGGAIIAAAPAVIFAFYKIFGIDDNSAVSVGSF